MAFLGEAAEDPESIENALQSRGVHNRVKS